MGFVTPCQVIKIAIRAVFIIRITISQANIFCFQNRNRVFTNELCNLFSSFLNSSTLIINVKSICFLIFKHNPYTIDLYFQNFTDILLNQTIRFYIFANINIITNVIFVSKSTNEFVIIKNYKAVENTNDKEKQPGKRFC